MSPEPRLIVTGPERVWYADGLSRQRALMERCIASARADNFLMLVEHPSVVTVGVSADDAEFAVPLDELKARGVEVAPTNRGGRLTVHSPGQFVAYPIIDLATRGCDLHVYLRDLEKWLIDVLAAYGIEGGLNAPHTGVWLGDRKIASVGIACRNWVAYHGVALNVENDLSLFDLIIPCGLHGVEMTSMEKELGHAPPLADVTERAAEVFARRFGFETVVRGEPDEDEGDAS